MKAIISALLAVGVGRHCSPDERARHECARRKNLRRTGPHSPLTQPVGRGSSVAAIGLAHCRDKAARGAQVPEKLTCGWPDPYRAARRSTSCSKLTSILVSKRFLRLPLRLASVPLKTIPIQSGAADTTPASNSSQHNLAHLAIGKCSPIQRASRPDRARIPIPAGADSWPHAR